MAVLGHKVKKYQYNFLGHLKAQIQNWHAVTSAVDLEKNGITKPS
jgi:hypothetical protein